MSVAMSNSATSLHSPIRLSFKNDKDLLFTFFITSLLLFSTIFLLNHWTPQDQEFPGVPCPGLGCRNINIEWQFLLYRHRANSKGIQPPTRRCKSPSSRCSLTILLKLKVGRSTNQPTHQSTISSSFGKKSLCFHALISWMMIPLAGAG